MDRKRAMDGGARGRRRLLVAAGAVICLLAMGSLAIYAADGGFGTLQMISEDGKARWSIDGGKVWNEGLPASVPDGVSAGVPDGLGLPEGLPEGADGQRILSSETGLPDGGSLTVRAGADVFGTVPDDPGDGANLAVRVHGDEVQYSTDGGKTWGDEPPAGVEAEFAEDGEGVVTMSSEVRELSVKSN